MTRTLLVLSLELFCSPDVTIPKGLSIRCAKRSWNSRPRLIEKRQAKIDEEFAKLESQIAALQQRGDPKVDQLKSQLASLRSDYQAARMVKAVQDAKNAIQGSGMP